MILSALLPVLLGCAGDPAPAETGDTSAEPDPCADEGSLTGTVVGTIDCDDQGRCAVPEGSFWMGGTQFPDECPVRQVSLSSYRIDRTEVTQAAYTACVEAGACAAASTGCMGEDVGDDLPQICIDWQDAADYCAYAGGRLPTEAEWERAARGDDGAKWAWGEAPPDCNTANFRYVAAYCHIGVMEVGSFPGVSAYGLVDTVGNAWEWVSDWYDATYYREAPSADPPGPEDDCTEDVNRDPAVCAFKGLRGGAYNTTEQTTRGSARAASPPEVIDVNIGFRCAYDGL